MNTLQKIILAGLTLNQIAIIFEDEIVATKSLSGQGEEITLIDGSEFIYDDSGNYLSVYDKGQDIYVMYERQGQCFKMI